MNISYLLRCLRPIHGQHRTQGITILELMISMGIIAILAAIALPSLTGHMQKTRLTAAIVELSQFWKQARYDVAGTTGLAQSLCMHVSDPIRYAQIAGSDCVDIPAGQWQDLTPGVQIDQSNSTLAQVTNGSDTFYRVSWIDLSGMAYSQLGKIVLQSGKHQKCIFLYSAGGDWRIVDDDTCNSFELSFELENLTSQCPGFPGGAFPGKGATEGVFPGGGVAKGKFSCSSLEVIEVASQ